MQPDAVPVLLARDRQEHADGKLVVLGRRGLEGGMEPRDVGRTQRAHIVRVVHVHDRPALLPRTAPVDHEDRLGDRIVLELHAAAAGREEDQLFPEGVQLALGAVAARHIAVLQQFGGQALRVLLHALLDREQRQRVPEVRADLLKAVEQHRVERAALPVEDHGDGGIVAVRLFVAAVARQRVIYVRQRDDLRRDRDLLAEQAVRVAAAVPPLVVVPHDERHPLELGHLAKDVVSRHGAAAHLLPLGVGQRPGFTQHGVGHRNFADVMGESGNLHRGGVVLAQVQDPGQHHRHSGHPVGMVGSVDIPCVHGGNDALDQIAADQVKVPECNVTTGKKVAIVGGGPSGLTTAYYLSLMGHKVDVYEEREALGGMLRYGIPNYRLPKDRLDEDINAILSTGNITVHYNTAIGRDITMEQLKEQYNAIYIAIGAQVGKSVNVDGVNSNGVYSAVEMLGEIGRGNIPDYTGKRVVVVGGGNVAMDCARSAIRCHAKEVTVIYRRRQIDMTALPSEIQGAIEEGVELLTLNAPVKINADAEGNVCGFVAQPQIISVYDKQGKPSVTVANKPEIEVPCEVVLMAIGQDIVSAPFAEYDVNPRRKTFETLDTTRLKSYDKIFSGGDCVFGPATVIKAIGAGKVAALNIDEYLGYHHKYLEDIKIPEPRENDRTHYGRVHLTDRSARERKNNFEPVENGMSYDEAMQECGKCLRCDHFGCGVVEGGRV